MLYDPRVHEPLTDAAWDPDAAGRAIAEIVADTLAARTEEWWPVHPLDRDPGDPEVWHGVYLGAAGVLWALRELGADVDGEVVDAPEFDSPGLWVGRGGVLLVDWLHTRSAEVEERLFGLTLEQDSLELMWGSPGLLVIADEMARRTGAARWEAAAEAIVRHLGGAEWEQELSGQRARYLGPAHGFAGIVLALARRGVVDPRTAGVLESEAVIEDGLANWPAVAGEGLEHKDTIRTQWCHGAPGIVTSMPFEHELLDAGAELVWRAGPLRKGANLCHGTAGNGFAFLKRFVRTGDELWLERARRFAMHAIEQVARDRAAHGQGRYSLWSGDLGTAIYLDQCLSARAELPALELW